MDPLGRTRLNRVSMYTTQPPTPLEKRGLLSLHGTTKLKQRLILIKSVFVYILGRGRALVSGKRGPRKFCKHEQNSEDLHGKYCPEISAQWGNLGERAGGVG